MADKKEKTVSENNFEKIEQKYSKRAILKSSKYSDKKDLIKTLLDDNKYYSLNNTDEIINKYLNKEVH